MLLAIAAKRIDSKLDAGVGVGVCATTGAGVAAGVRVGTFFVKDGKGRELKSNDPVTQYLQRSVDPSGTSNAVQG